MKNVAERRTTMTTKVKLKNGGAIEVRIEKGQIAEITYSHGTTITAKRENRAEIEFRMKNIFEDNVDEFKKLLKRIESDEDFYSYGRSLLDTKIEALLEAIKAYRRECDRRLKQMQEEVDRYTL